MSIWLRRIGASRDRDAVRLVCFPHAGGAASFFSGWDARLPGVEVHAVRYPGRAERIGEPCATDLRALAGNIARAIAGARWPGPVALFGHSLGAMVALETARALDALDQPVAHLFASGSRDAPLPDASEQGGDDDGDEAAAIALLELGGTSPELTRDPEFLELVLPYVQADTLLFHGYQHRAHPALSCPVSTITGDADAHADRRPWRELTRSLTEYVVPGHHFYLLARPPAGLVAATLNGLAGRDAATGHRAPLSGTASS
ncbi:MAG TPA: alpha/beta fold hydrolase [Trebonia sp.]|nr:alpha/beta fold hydrolase [Trebonia sp.]